MSIRVYVQSLLLFAIAFAVVTPEAHATVRQVIGGDNTAGPFWNFGGGTQYCTSMTTALTSGTNDPTTQLNQRWPGVCPGIASPITTVYRPTSSQGRIVATQDITAFTGTGTAKLDTFMTYYGEIKQSPSPPCPFGICNPTYGIAEAATVNVFTITNNFNSSVMSISGVPRNATKLYTLAFYGEELDMLVGGVGQNTGRIASLAMTTGVWDYEPGCGGGTRLCSANAVVGVDPSGGAANIESFLTTSKNIEGYSFPLVYKCADYAMKITEVAHADWGTRDANPVLMTSIPWGPGKLYQRAYGPGNSNTMRVNIHVDAQDKAYDISVGIEDFSPNNGGLEFEIYCVEPDVPLSPNAGDGICDTTSAPPENQINAWQDCACTQRHEFDPKPGNPFGPNACCSAGDTFGVGGYCCPSGWSFNAIAAACLPPTNDGFCDTVNGENPVNSPADCPTAAVCPLGMTWNGVACVASQNCGDPGTTTPSAPLPCSTLGAPISSAYYCSDGINTDDGNSANGQCCPSGTAWTGASCLTTARCDSPVTCPAAAPISPPTAPNALYYSSATCVGSTAYLGSPGACCNVGTKYGFANWYDYSDSTGSTTNYFGIY